MGVGVSEQLLLVLGMGVSCQFLGPQGGYPAVPVMVDAVAGAAPVGTVHQWFVVDVHRIIDVVVVGVGLVGKREIWRVIGGESRQQQVQV